MNFEAVTARYVDVRLERKKEVLDAYHGAVKQADSAKAKEAEPKKAKSATKKEQRNRVLTALSLYCFLQPFITPRGIWAPFTEKAPPTQEIKETPKTRKNIVFMQVSGVF